MFVTSVHARLNVIPHKSAGSKINLHVSHICLSHDFDFLLEAERILTPPSLMDQPESIPLKMPENHSSSVHYLQTSTTPQHASASPSPSRIVNTVESLPSSQSESSILHTTPVHSRLVQSSSLCRPHPPSQTASAEWCAGISRSVQTELTSPVDAGRRKRCES